MQSLVYFFLLIIIHSRTNEYYKNLQIVYTKNTKKNSKNMNDLLLEEIGIIFRFLSTGVAVLLIFR